MTSKKTTRRALLTSMLSLLICVSMLVGSTFAWFTDSVTSANNIIKSGNLDVELYYQVEGQTDWTKVTENTNIFKENALWEPGHTEVVKLKVVNEGTLALKYQLGVNVASETGSTNKDGKAFKLSDYIKFGIVDGAQTYTREQAVAAVDASATALNRAYNSEVTTLLAETATNTDNEDIITMVVYMPTTVGNEANYAKDAAVPTIKLGINLYATQVENESDSFGPTYDKGAAWDGVVPDQMPDTLVVDGDTQTVHVKDAAAFAYLSTLSAKWVEFYTDGNGTDYSNYANGAGGNYYYSGQWSISLEADINLMNHPIEPVVIKFGASTGASAFNGNNHVISNINTTTGLFANNNRAKYSDLTLVNVKATNGALTGSANTNISNVTVKNATISGTDYVGGLVGYIYGDVTGCEVVDSSVAGVKEVGGLIGFIDSSSGDGKVTENEVRNVSVFANNRAAGLVAQANAGVKVYNNVVDTATVAAVDISKYLPGAVISNAIVPANVYDNTVNNCKVGREVYGLTLFPNGENSQIIVNDKEGFLNLTKLFADWTALFTDGNGNEAGNYVNGAGVDYYYGYRWTISLEADIDLNNATIAPVTIKHPVKAGAPSFEGNNHTIKNAKVVTDATTANVAGLFNGEHVAFKNLKLDNIHVTGSNVGDSTAGISYCSSRCLE